MLASEFERSEIPFVLVDVAGRIDRRMNESPVKKNRISESSKKNHHLSNLLSFKFEISTGRGPIEIENRISESSKNESSSI